MTSLAVSPTKLKNMAGDEGAAPSPAVSETAALLLRQSPLAPEEGFAPSPTRGNSSPAYSLAYSGMKMVEVEGLAPPLRLGVGQLP